MRLVSSIKSGVIMYKKLTTNVNFSSITLAPAYWRSYYIENYTSIEKTLYLYSRVIEFKPHTVKIQRLKSYITLPIWVCKIQKPHFAIVYISLSNNVNIYKYTSSIMLYP